MVEEATSDDIDTSNFVKLCKYIYPKFVNIENCIIIIGEEIYEMINLSYFFLGSSNRVVCQGVEYDLDSGWVLDGNSIARSSSTYHYFLLSSLI